MNSVHVLPRFSVLDPETTFSLPPRQTANGVVTSMLGQVYRATTDSAAPGLTAAAIRARLTATGGHIHLLIPSEHAGSAPKIGYFAEDFFEFL